MSSQSHSSPFCVLCSFLQVEGGSWLWLSLVLGSHITGSCLIAPSSKGVTVPIQNLPESLWWFYSILSPSVSSLSLQLEDLAHWIHDSEGNICVTGSSLPSILPGCHESSCFPLLDPSWFPWTEQFSFTQPFFCLPFQTCSHSSMNWVPWNYETNSLTSLVSCFVLITRKCSIQKRCLSHSKAGK